MAAWSDLSARDKILSSFEERQSPARRLRGRLGGSVGCAREGAKRDPRGLVFPLLRRVPHVAWTQSACGPRNEIFGWKESAWLSIRRRRGKRCVKPSSASCASSLPSAAP